MLNPASLSSTAEALAETLIRLANSLLTAQTSHGRDPSMPVPSLKHKLLLFVLVSTSQVVHVLPES